MARPKLGDSESKRLQMVITEDELIAIDDWRFPNRIGTRSEAIRRLCQIAIAFESLFPRLRSLISEETDARFEMFQLLEDLELRKVSFDADACEVRRAAENDIEQINRAFHKSDSSSMDLAFLIINMADVLKSLAAGGSLEQSIEDVRRRAGENELYKRDLKGMWEPKK